MYLKEAKKQSQDIQNPAQTSTCGGDNVAIYDISSAASVDSIAALYGIDPQQIPMESFPDGRRQLRIPVRKIHTVRFYDNLATLEKLYGTPREKIIRVNGLKGESLEPAREIIIPL
jgi:hypothetical protein